MVRRELILSFSTQLALKDANDDGTQKNTEIQSQNESIASLKAEHKNLITKKTEEIIGLKTMVKSLESELIDNTEKCNLLQNELESVELERKSLKLEIASSQKHLVDTQAELSTTSMLVDKLRCEITEPEVWTAMKGSLDEKDMLISELRENENFLTEKISDLEKEIKTNSKLLETEKGITQSQAIQIKNINQSLTAAKEQSKRLITLNEEVKQAKFSRKKSEPTSGDEGNSSHVNDKKPVENIIWQKDDLRRAVEHNKICIREVNQHGSCNPRSSRGCSFSHSIPEDLDNATRNSLMLLWSETHRKCAFEFTLKGSCKEKETCPQCLYKKQQMEDRSVNSDRPKYCYSELNEQGSCRWKEKCRFSHDIPLELRQDEVAQTEYLREKGRKVGKCVNEYRKKDSCRKGLLCRFSHDISDEDRSNQELQAHMDLKYQNIIYPNKKNDNTSSTTGLTIDEVQKLFTQFITQLNTTASRNP